MPDIMGRSLTRSPRCFIFPVSVSRLDDKTPTLDQVQTQPSGCSLPPSQSAACSCRLLSGCTVRWLFESFRSVMPSIHLKTAWPTTTLFNSQERFRNWSHTEVPWPPVRVEWVCHLSSSMVSVGRVNFTLISLQVVLLAGQVHCPSHPPS